MAKIRWVNVMHLYQPPWQNAAVLDRVVRESYSLIAGALEKNPSFRMTLNLTGSLIELLEERGHRHILDALKKSYLRGQIEITGSAFSHAFLPQLPDHEIARQITLQEQILRKHFAGWQRAGFFLPEMAYSTRAAALIRAQGYRWIILDPINMRTAPNTSVKYLSRRSGLAVVFRNRQISKAYPPEEIAKLLPPSTDRTIITATDGELYGHFHKDWQNHLKKIITSNAVTTATVSEYLKTLTKVEPVYLRSASWESRDRSMHTNNPFSIWYNATNPIHKRLWKLAHLAIGHLQRNGKDPNFYWARKHLDRGLASCSWWWASGVKTSPFAPIGWNPDETEKGARELIKSIRSLRKITVPDKMQAEKLYHDLMLALWLRHWHTYGRR